MNKKLKKVLRIVFVLLAVFFLFAVWYKWKYSMDTAPSYTINNPAPAKNVLIATQGSVYKNKLTKVITEELDAKQFFIKVIDVSDLPTIDAKEWDAVMLIHTWEMEKPPQAIADFVSELDNTNKLIVHTTSGEGSRVLEHVDGISGASVMDDISKVKDEMIGKLVGQ